jgi:hypothetical protein
MSRLVLGLNDPPLKWTSEALSLGNNVARGSSYTPIYCQIKNVWFASMPSHFTSACSMSKGATLPGLSPIFNSFENNSVLIKKYVRVCTCVCTHKHAQHGTAGVKQNASRGSHHVVSCAVPVGNVSWMLFQEGRSSNFS